MTAISLKTATKASIAACGGLDAAATITRVGKTALSEYQNRNSASVVPVDIAADLDLCAEQPLILAALAQMQGYQIIALKVGDGDVAASMERVAASSGVTMATAVRVMADGIITPDEAHDLLRDVGELHRLCGHALQVLRAQFPAALREVG